MSSKAKEMANIIQLGVVLLNLALLIIKLTKEVSKN